MNQNKNYGNRCPEICRKIFRALCRIAWGGEAPNPAQSEANPSVDIQSKPEGGRRITLVLGNGERKSSTSDLPDNRVAIVAARTVPLNTPGHQEPRQPAKRAAVTKPGLPVLGSGLEKTRQGSITAGSGSEVTVVHGERANKPKLESTSSVDQESKGTGHDMEQRFSDYIHRKWLKFRSESNVGRDKDHPPMKDSEHDRFEDYITQAKKKLRTTSGIGGGVASAGGRGFSSK